MVEYNLQMFGGRGASSGIKKLTRSDNNGSIEMNLQFFARKPGGRKVPKDNPLWDSLVMGDREWQKKQGTFEHEHGGYKYLIEYDEDYLYKEISKKKMRNIHEKGTGKRKRNK